MRPAVGPRSMRGLTAPAPDEQPSKRASKLPPCQDNRSGRSRGTTGAEPRHARSSQERRGMDARSPRACRRAQTSTVRNRQVPQHPPALVPRGRQRMRCTGHIPAPDRRSRKAQRQAPNPHKLAAGYSAVNTHRRQGGIVGMTGSDGQSRARSGLSARPAIPPSDGSLPVLWRIVHSHFVLCGELSGNPQRN